MLYSTRIVFYVMADGERRVVVASSLPRGPALDSAMGGMAMGRAADAGAGEMRRMLTVGGDRLVGLGRSLVNPGADEPQGGYVALRSQAAESAPTLALAGLIPAALS